MNITTEMIKELRDSTGVSVMQCKKALEEAQGDMEKALMILRKKSSEIAAKKSDRETNDGLVATKTEGGKTVLLVLKCETDFVAKNEDFVALAKTLADKAIAGGKEAVEQEAAEIINPVIQKVGEKIELGEVTVYDNGVIGTYVHNGKSGVMVSLRGGTEELARDIAMHIAAMKPVYLAKSDVPEEMKQKATELFSKEVAESNKPEEIKKKMLEGKIDTYFKEQTLLDQPFIKNPDMTISALLQKAGQDVKINKFTRVSLA